MLIFKRIINKFFYNNYNKNVVNEFNSWLIDDINTDEKDIVLKNIWDRLDVKAGKNTLKSLAIVEEKLRFRKKKRYLNQIQITRIAKIAAVILLPLVSSILTYMFLGNTPPEPDKPVKFSESFVAEGEIKSITLPDSTKVILNSSSVLIYPEEQKNDIRYVYLNGEAYFEVYNNDNIPFVVKTDGLDVEVLGTKFNVSAYSDSPNITTSLAEGKVRIRFNNKNIRNIILAPNDHLIYNKFSNEITHTQISSSHIAAWKDGYMVFIKSHLIDILKAFEHKYGVTVYMNTNKYEEDILTVKFLHGETLEESLKVIQKMIPQFKYIINENKIFIK